MERSIWQSLELIDGTLVFNAESLLATSQAQSSDFTVVSIVDFRLPIPAVRIPIVTACISKFHHRLDLRLSSIDFEMGKHGKQ